MKSLKEFLIESQGSSFSYNENISMKQFKDWEKKNKDKYDIVYSEADQLYTIYYVKNKSNPVWKGEHIATYNANTGDFYCDDKKILK